MANTIKDGHRTPSECILMENFVTRRYSSTDKPRQIRQSVWEMSGNKSQVGKSYDTEKTKKDNQNKRDAIKSLDFFYDCCCVIAFISCASWCTITWLQDHDTTSVDLLLYNDNSNNLYPSISLLIINPFIEEKLNGYGEGITANTYSKFLAGDYWDERMLYIDYDNVTVDLNDYFIGYEMLSDNFSVISIDNFTDNPATSYGWKKPYKNFRSYGWQTFAVDPPSNTYGGVTKFLVQTWIKIRTDLFENSLRQNLYQYNPDHPNFGGFEVWFHYPKQLLESWHLGMGKWFWPHRDGNSSINYVMVFERSKMEVLQRRNKRNEPCIEDWKNHDDYVIQEIIARAGCRPPYWKSKGVRLCSSKEEMKKVLPPLTKHDYLDYTPPCRSVTNLPFSFQEIDENLSRDPAYFRISMTSADTTFKNIEHLVEYTGQNLVGNIGGYLGLILGYALVHLPMSLYRILKVGYFVIFP